ncbi:12391_t:CDS:2 [Ambispora gerdemannii]|uniref:H/ACA ribonucleoprotein complex non-core subunit NAF1 n=1 Tax=Ambispora gerdemannii TaxID=144530 RepID=A0A9N8VCS9_9GLOM|nr:12391_t:CDS:2 [Ambispora gerdemannii]
MALNSFTIDLSKNNVELETIKELDKECVVCEKLNGISSVAKKIEKSVGINEIPAEARNITVIPIKVEFELEKTDTLELSNVKECAFLNNELSDHGFPNDIDAENKVIPPFETVPHTDSDALNKSNIALDKLIKANINVHTKEEDIENMSEQNQKNNSINESLALNHHEQQIDTVTPQLSVEEREALLRKMDMLLEAEIEESEESEALEDEDSDDSGDSDSDNIELNFDKVFDEKKNILHTKNEIIDVPVNKPEVNITDDLEIQAIGTINHIVENVVVVSSLFSDRNKVLDAGSILVFENRELIGEIFETFGPVHKPHYSIRFKDEEEINIEKYRQGVKAFVVLKFAKHVFVKPLQQIKGSDASNQFDEEIDESEIEFSDDEREAAHKGRLLHQKRQRQVNSYESTSTERTPKIRRQPNQRPSYRTNITAQTDNSFEYIPLQRPRQMITPNNNINY